MPITLATWVTSIALSVGVGEATAAVIGNAIIAGGWLGIAAAGFAIANTFIGSPALPKPADGKQAKRQSIPVRQRGFGKCRNGGYYMCYEEKDGVSYDVVALHDGKIDGIEQYLLNEDFVTLVDGVVQAGSDGRYANSLIAIATRMGEAVETAYSAIVTGLSGIWTTDHRGDGIASLSLICGKVSAENYLKEYPNQLPVPSVVARWQLCWDPREVDQSYSDPDTWAWTDNPVLHLLKYITSQLDMDQDIATRILPEIDSWIEAANVCDENVELAAGGTEKRYTAGGIYQADNDPADVIGILLACFDGWLGETGSGALKVVAGKFYTPTKSVPTQHITGFRVQRYTPDEQAINQIDFSYTSPSHRYTEVQGESWRNEADISARGKTRVKSLSLTWVQSHSQGRRLCKREMARQSTDAQGTITTDLFGLTLLGERYIYINLPDLPSLGTFAVQIQNATIDFSNRALSFDWIKVDASIDDWDKDTEEGTPPPDLDDVSSSGADSAITASPDNVAAIGAVGHATITWRNPASYNFSYVEVFRGSSTDPFSSAVAISGELTGGLAQNMSYQDDHSAGTFRYWVVAYTASDEASIPTGPVTATIT